jgi:hypothetical protein
MSDYIPNPPNPDRDPRNYDRYYEHNSSRGLTLVIGILVAIALVAGLMYFAGNHQRNEQAQAPIERTVNPPANTGNTGAPALPPSTATAPANPTAPRQ